ncbi:glycosyltransferase family 2 protein [Pedobacter sp. MC2016-15]|uniref:glycosyltransferase family 2 protein n=1 Tax=Pedobacter sp. MC2016-15 TaxID=2994473 RepID=UPI0022458793|nr:glycosyltransferase family 2 protein [Pedobacter sp. MC2016-15]MCX2481822.1 glycosyltransferase family 2 protein [Pedobacter sp. MC2016-15]
MRKISVVMTTYNGERFLREQMESILSQTLQPDEIIVCDDRSSDGTVAILEQYKHIKGFSYVVNEQQLGLIRNYKKAVSLAAKDNFVALSDQDDIWLADKLMRSAELLTKLDPLLPCMVHTDLIWVDEQQNILNPSFQNERRQSNYQHNLQTLLFANFATGCTILMNPLLRQFFAEIPDNIKFHDAWLALAAFTFGQVGEITEPTIKYRRHGSNLSFTSTTKRYNRYRQIWNEMLTSLKGDDSFLSLQFGTARQFYDQYNKQMNSDIKYLFEKFMKLEHRSYISKKIAYRKAVLENPVFQNK